MCDILLQGAKRSEKGRDSRFFLDGAGKRVWRCLDVKCVVRIEQKKCQVSKAQANQICSVGPSTNSTYHARRPDETNGSKNFKLYSTKLYDTIRSVVIAVEVFNDDKTESLKCHQGMRRAKKMAVF